MGLANKGLGRLVEAEEGLRNAIQLDPYSPQTQNNLGTTLHALGKWDEAQTAYTKALSVKPDYAEAHANLGLLQHDQGFPDDAIAAFKKAISIKPDYAEAHNNIGLTLHQNGKLDEAISAFKNALLYKPELVDAHLNMGLVFRQKGEFIKALSAFRKALLVKPGLADVHFNMGIVLQQTKNFDEAIGAFMTALSIERDYPKAQEFIGDAYSEQNMSVPASSAYIKALALDPNNFRIHKRLGNMLEIQGKLDQAADAYLQALSIRPNYSEAHRHLSMLKTFKAGDPQIAVMQNLLSDPNLGNSNRINTCFALAKVFEDLGDLERSFVYLVEGNSLNKTSLKYDIQQDKILFQEIRQSAASVQEHSLKDPLPADSVKPIFILGMPRSGTTLIEQIISAHSHVTGAGELRHVEHYGADVAAGICTPSIKILRNFRNEYLTNLDRHSYGKPFVTDKMPHNFRYIGLICSSFPDVKIVHVKREAPAICWSNYRNYFTAKGLGYSFDLRDIALYYRMYKDLMDLWNKLFTDRIYSIDYDKLTVDQEKETRCLFKYLDLPWEDACLFPHENTRDVNTASRRQVRKSVYKDSSLHWNKYRPYLNGAFDGLN